MNSLKYYKSLDGLRGIAALMVLIFHFFTFSISDYVTNDLYKKLTEFGQHGVSLFFVLSGFVITRILINSKNNDDYFKRFYWRRSLRIFPLYYLFLIFWYFVMPYILHGEKATIQPFSNQLPFYLYIHNFQWLTAFEQSGPTHYWSLAVEEHFYLLWPLVIFITPNKHIKKLIIVLILIAIPIKILMMNMGIIINKTTLTRYDQILLGALLAYSEFKGFFEKNNNTVRNTFIYTLIAVIPISILIYLGQKYYPEIKEILKYNLLGLIFFSIIGLLIYYEDRKKIFNTILKSTILQYLGKISYGIYVWHLFVLFFIEKYFLSEIIIVDILTCCMLTIIIAHISYHYFEKKILNYK